MRTGVNENIGTFVNHACTAGPGRLFFFLLFFLHDVGFSFIPAIFICCFAVARVSLSHVHKKMALFSLEGALQEERVLGQRRALDRAVLKAERAMLTTSQNGGANRTVAEDRRAYLTNFVAGISRFRPSCGALSTVNVQCFLGVHIDGHFVRGVRSTDYQAICTAAMSFARGSMIQLPPTRDFHYRDATEVLLRYGQLPPAGGTPTDRPPELRISVRADATTVTLAEHSVQRQSLLLSLAECPRYDVSASATIVHSFPGLVNAVGDTPPENPTYIREYSSTEIECRDAPAWVIVLSWVTTRWMCETPPRVEQTCEVSFRLGHIATLIDGTETDVRANLARLTGLLWDAVLSPLNTLTSRRRELGDCSTCQLFVDIPPCGEAETHAVWRIVSAALGRGHNTCHSFPAAVPVDLTRAALTALVARGAPMQVTEKIRGERHIMVMAKGGNIYLCNRTMRVVSLASRYPDMANAYTGVFQAVEGKETVIDGEIVANLARPGSYVFVAFDLLSFKGMPQRAVDFGEMVRTLVNSVEKPLSSFVGTAPFTLLAKSYTDWTRLAVVVSHSTTGPTGERFVFLRPNVQVEVNGLVFVGPDTRDTYKWTPSAHTTADFWPVVGPAKIELCASTANEPVVCAVVPLNDALRASLQRTSMDTELLRRMHVYQRPPRTVLECRFSPIASQWEVIRARPDKDTATSVMDVVRTLERQAAPLAVRDICSAVATMMEK